MSSFQTAQLKGNQMKLVEEKDEMVMKTKTSGTGMEDLETRDNCYNFRGS